MRESEASADSGAYQGLYSTVRISLFEKTTARDGPTSEKESVLWGQ